MWLYFLRVAGPFTVESLTPHSTLGVDENDELIDDQTKGRLGFGKRQDFAEMILEDLTQPLQLET